MRFPGLRGKTTCHLWSPRFFNNPPGLLTAYLMIPKKLGWIEWILGSNPSWFLRFVALRAWYCVAFLRTKSYPMLLDDLFARFPDQEEMSSESTHTTEGVEVTIQGVAREGVILVQLSMWIETRSYIRNRNIWKRNFVFESAFAKIRVTRLGRNFI